MFKKKYNTNSQMKNNKIQLVRILSSNSVSIYPLQIQYDLITFFQTPNDSCINSYKKEGRKEMFYLTTHSTHFIYGYMHQTYGKGPLR